MISKDLPKISPRIFELAKIVRAYAEHMVFYVSLEPYRSSESILFEDWVVACRCMEWSMRSWTRSRYALDSLIHARLKRLCATNDRILSGVFLYTYQTKEHLYDSLCNKWKRVFRHPSTLNTTDLFTFLQGLNTGVIDFSALRSVQDIVVPRGPYHNHIPRSTFLIHYHAIRAGISVPDTEIEVV